MSAAPFDKPICPSNPAGDCVAVVCDEHGGAIRTFGEPDDDFSHNWLPAALDSLRPGVWPEFLGALSASTKGLDWAVDGVDKGAALKLWLHGCRTATGFFVCIAVRPDPTRTTSEEGAGEPAGTGAVITDDLTWRWQHAEGRFSALWRLRQQSSEQLLNAVHDLRNPISSIISSCDYLTAYCVDNLEPEQLEVVERIEVSAQALLKYSDRIRELAAALSSDEIR